MAIDLEKLTPAPWEASIGNIGGPNITANGRFIADVRAAFFRMQFDKEKAFDIEDAGPEAAANSQFIALARNALDVMTRRGWTTIQYVDRTWGVVEGYETDKFPKGLGGQSWPDPFTALVEADKWYKENVESRINPSPAPTERK